MWQGTGSSLATSETLETESDIVVLRVHLKDGAGFLVSLPRPHHPAEAGLALIPDRPSPTRYFVLELGWDVVERHPYWVLCEWDHSGHANFGRCGDDPGTDPELVRPQMLDRVSEILASEVQPGG
jgi:hypothetical protein